MYAIVQTGGKQYKVQPGDQFKVERLPVNEGDTVDLTQVLAISTPEGITLGHPFLENTTVKATVLGIAKDRKVIIFKKKRRQGYHKKQGHRQWYSLLRVDEIHTGGEKTALPASAIEGETPSGAVESGE